MPFKGNSTNSSLYCAVWCMHLVGQIISPVVFLFDHHNT
jgi:hypothetical protein